MGRTRPGQARTELARARIRLGLSQHDAAEAVGVSPTTWGRWERGGQNLRPAYRARIARLFAVDPLTVEQWLDGTDAARRSTGTALFPVADFEEQLSPSTVDSFDHLWRSDMDPARRRALASLPFVPAALGEWLSSAYDTPTRPVADRDSGLKVGRADVARINEARQAFTRMDYAFGSRLVRPAIIDYLTTTVAPLLRGNYDDEVGVQLLIAAAGFTRLAGVTAYDLGHQGQAQRYLGQALRLARAAEDPLTTAWVLTALTHQAIHLGHGAWAVRLSRAAAETARRGHASPRTMALLLVREAWATALHAKPAETGDRHTAKHIAHLLNEAERSLDRDPTEQDPAWIRRYEPTELHAEAARCLLLLGDHRRAATFATEAVAEYRTRLPRSAQLNAITAAEAHLAMGELEQAVTQARSMIPMTQALPSPRALDRLRAFTDQLTPYDSVQVREFRDYVNRQLAA